MKREQILEKAKACVCTDRENQYGKPENNFMKIANLWSEYLQTDISPADVAVMMILLKVARIQTGHKSYADTWVDIAGYSACGGEIATEREGA